MTQYIKSETGLFLPPSAQSRSRGLTGAIGVSGTELNSGFIREIEINPKLRGKTKYRTYSNILSNTSIVAAGTRYFLNLVAKAGWKANPANDTPQAREMADRVMEIIEDMDTAWHRVVRRGAMSRFYGFSIQEWIAKRRPDNTFGFQDVAPRPQITIDRWDCDARTGQVNGVVQKAPNSGQDIYIPRNRLVYIVDDSLNDSPEGLGLFRHLVDTVNRLKAFEKFEGLGFENDLSGTPVARGPLSELQAMVERGDISDTQKAAIEQPLRNWINNHRKGDRQGLLIDSSPYFGRDDAETPSSKNQWDVELLQSNSRTQNYIHQAIERLNREAARVIGVEHLLLGGDSRGSLALSKDKSDNFFLIIDSTLSELETSFQRDLINRLWEINGWDPELRPKLSAESVKFRDVEQITAVLRDMALAGVILDPNDPAINEIRDLIGLSPRAHVDKETESELEEMSLITRGANQDRDNGNSDD